MPWVQIMENEFECLFDRGHGRYFAEKFVDLHKSALNMSNILIPGKISN